MNGIANKNIESEIKNFINNEGKFILKQIENDIDEILRNSRMFYKMFTRIKSPESILSKLNNKYIEKGGDYKIQDILGVRIVLYFVEDIEICQKLILDNYCYADYDNKTFEKKKDETEIFKARKLNIVCKSKHFETESKYFDSTFEVQIRTMLSEGWHEVEHDLRYKCKTDWENSTECNKVMNGMLATLETCDWTISYLFDKLAYEHYKRNEWEAMIRSKYKIRFEKGSLDNEIVALFNNNSDLAKKFYKADRNILAEKLSFSKGVITSTFDNIIFIINYFEVKSKEIECLMGKNKIYLFRKTFDKKRG